MGLKELKQNLAILQGLLGLLGWKITLRWALKKDEFCQSQAGQASWVAVMKTAEICIDKASEDHLHTLTHEMLHIFFEGHSSERSLIQARDSETYEGCLNRLASLLVKLLEKEDSNGE